MTTVAAYPAVRSGVRVYVGFFSLRELSLHRDKILVTCQRAGKAPRKFFLTSESLKEDLIQRKIPYQEQAAEQYLPTCIV